MIHLRYIGQLEAYLEEEHAGKRHTITAILPREEVEELYALLSAGNVRPLEDWHEDMGSVLWWKFPIIEPPYVGSPLDCGQTVEAHTHRGLAARFDVGGWPGYHTHFTPIVTPKEPQP